MLLYITDKPLFVITGLCLDLTTFFKTFMRMQPKNSLKGTSDLIVQPLKYLLKSWYLKYTIGIQITEIACHYMNGLPFSFTKLVGGAHIGMWKCNSGLLKVLAVKLLGKCLTLCYLGLLTTLNGLKVIGNNKLRLSLKPVDSHCALAFWMVLTCTLKVWPGIGWTMWIAKKG